MRSPHATATRHAGPTRVCLVEDHHVVRHGLEMLLERSGFAVVAGVGAAAEALDAVREHDPDVAIVDLVLPDEPASALIKRLLAHAPDLRILVYTGSVDADEIGRAMEAGAHGVVAKSSDPAHFRRAVAIVRDGGTFIDEQLTPALTGAPATQRTLTRREAEILELLAVGLSGEEAASRLVLSGETVRTHIRNASTKLGARTRAHALVLALQRGEISP